MSTDWNKRYEEHQTPWEKGGPAPPLLEILDKKSIGMWSDGQILVPGCGMGHDVRALAAAGFDVLGVDLAPLAVERAKQYARVGTESYALGDFLDNNFAEPKSFGAVWEHTCFCAIDPDRRPAYAAACGRLIRPGGRLIGVFFLTPQSGKDLDEGPPFNATIEEIDQLFSGDFVREEGWVPSRTYQGREGQEWVGIYRRR